MNSWSTRTFGTAVAAALLRRCAGAGRYRPKSCCTPLTARFQIEVGAGVGRVRDRRDEGFVAVVVAAEEGVPGSNRTWRLRTRRGGGMVGAASSRVVDGGGMFKSSLPPPLASRHFT